MSTAREVESYDDPKALRSELKILLKNHRIDGREFGVRLSENADEIIKALTEHHLGNLAQQISFVALGGNGRKDITSQSDLDLLVLLPEALSKSIDTLYEIRDRRTKAGQDPDGKLTLEEQTLFDSSEAKEAAIEFTAGYTYFCADLNDLGFSTASAFPRTLSQTKQETLKDQTIWSSLLDAHLICGDKPLYAELEELLDELRANSNLRAKFAYEKFDERTKRLEKETRNTFRPDIKNGYGSLRDYQGADWHLKVVFGVKTPKEAEEKGLFSESELKRAQKSYAFLLTMRCHLRNNTANTNDILAPNLRTSLAQQMQYTGVQKMMQDFFMHRRELGFFANITEALVREELEQKQVFEPIQGTHFEISENYIRFSDATITDPVDMLRIYKMAQAQEVNMHHSALRTIRDNVERIAEYRDNPDVNKLFLDILTSDNCTGKALRQMQELGLMQEFLPPFKMLDSMPANDFVHHQTIDEHHFACLEMLNALKKGQHKENAPLATGLFEKGISDSQKRVLYTTVLFYDIGTDQAGGHLAQGAQLAEEYCPRLGLNPEETNMVCWLVENNSFLLQGAVHRDPHDVARIGVFTDCVDTPEKLELLTLLTTARRMSIDPGRWTAYNEKNVLVLYNQALTCLHDQSLTIGPRFELSANHDPGSTNITVVPDHAGGAVITVLTPDKDHLFENVTGALGAQNIRKIVVYTFDKEGDTPVAYQKLSVSSAKPEDGGYKPEDLEKIKVCVEEAINYDEAHIFPESGYQLRRSWQADKDAIPVNASVAFDNAASNDRTVVDITARDKLGLAHRIASIFGKHGVQVSCVFGESSGGHSITDAFYVSDSRTHKKIIDPDRIADIQKELENLIQEPVDEYFESLAIG